MFNKDALLNSNVKLDTFELKDNNHFHYEYEENSLWDLLYQFHTNGFSKRLQLYGWRDFPRDPLSSIQFLEQLYLADFDLLAPEPLSTHFFEYAETAEIETLSWNSIMDSGKSKIEIFVEQFMNVERLYLKKEKLDILLFIKKLRILKKIKLFNFKSAEILQLDNVQWTC